MFIIAQIEDIVKLTLDDLDLNIKIIQELNIKYTNNVINNIGLAISIEKLRKIYHYKIVDGYLHASVKFDVIFFKFFENETIYAKIYKQEENGIWLALPFFMNIFVKEENLPKDSSKTFTNSKNNRKNVLWYWMYKDSKLYFKNNETVRFKVTKIEFSPFLVYGRMNDPGLGPISWW
ncbi:subunit Rpc8 of DNA-directed RNA polymerase III [Hamiltosporidium magnivora]|uniref:Subunit Rpc8 of DNA-directed RNA polymerase III n=1 Tax=Hamiltosporidium magnivora TaxID=148818 RepID=A0A4Q9LGY3_9MICR|nr:subunit Rpc8 of DNA-directed RNA polymerase III [Hamiltosporidium magnivora]